MIPIRDNIKSRRTPVVNYIIIASCVIVFWLQLVGVVPHEMAFRPTMLVPGRSPGVQAALGALVLSMFMHGSLAHIGFNMLFLWVFGDNVEDRMGHVKYAAFYLICGTIATIAHSGFALLTGGEEMALVGASGAIAGVLGAYFVVFRYARVATLIPMFFLWPIVYIPAPVFLIYWVITQVISLPAGGPVAYMAHLGGFGAGYLLVRVFADTTQPRPPKDPPTPRVTDLRIE